MTQTLATAAPAPAALADASIVFNRAQFHHALTSASKFASKDATLPVLRTVAVQFDGTTGTTYVMATDRFRLAVEALAGKDNATLQPAAADPQLSAISLAPVLVDIDDVKRIIALVKTPARMRDVWEVRVTLGGGVLTVDTGDGAVTARIIDGEFPKVGRLLEGVQFAPAGTRTGDDYAGGGVQTFTPALLADFKSAVRDSGDSLTIVCNPNPGKPAAVTVGDHFIGLIMPVRGTEQTNRFGFALPTW